MKSNMQTVTKSIHLDFAHVVEGHPGRCINLHGHTWMFEIVAGAKELDETGFVLDFKKLRTDVLQPAFDLLDHTLLLSKRTFDEAYGSLCLLGHVFTATRGGISEVCSVQQDIAGLRQEICGGIRVVTSPFSPTSERLAEWLFHFASDMLNDERVKVLEARVYETLHPVAAVAAFSQESTNE